MVQGLEGEQLGAGAGGQAGGLASGDRLRFGGPRCVNPESGSLAPSPYPWCRERPHRKGGSTESRSLLRPEVGALLGEAGHLTRVGAASLVNGSLPSPDLASCCPGSQGPCKGVGLLRPPTHPPTALAPSSSKASACVNEEPLG